jgi:cytochrome o ubiquinol oxidase subunit 2
MISLLARRGLILLCVALLAGCDTIVLNPSGDIAAQQSKLIVILLS